MKEADFRIAVLNDHRVPPTARLVGVTLAYRCWRQWELYASHATVGKWAGVGTRTAQRAVEALRDVGYLWRTGAGPNGTIRYKMVIPADVPTAEPPEEPEPAPQQPRRTPVQTPRVPSRPAPVGVDEHGIRCMCSECEPPF